MSNSAFFASSTISPLFFNEEASICANTFAACVPP
jgi:hypothetical protein